MDKNQEIKNNQKEKEPSSSKEVERLTEELIQKLSSKSTSNKKNLKRDISKNRPKVFSLKINPLFLIIFIFVLGIFFINITNRSSESIFPTTLDSLVSGLKENRFASLFIQNDGKVVANSKSYVVINSGIEGLSLGQSSTLKFSSYKNGDLDILTLDQFIESLTPKDTLSALRSLFNNSNSMLEEILIAENYIIGITPSNSKDVIIKGVTEEEFISKLQNKGLSLESISVPVKKLKFEQVLADSKSLNERMASNQLSNLIMLDGVVLARTKPSEIQKFFVEWNPNLYSFTELLQKEGISIDGDLFSISSVNIPVGIGFSDIINIITLIGFIVLIFFIFRGAQSSGMGIMQFGQSKAKVFFGSKTDTSFKDVAGIDEAKNELFEIVDFLRNPNKYRDLGARIPKGILLVGPPGTGKTLLARAIAGEAKVPFFHTSGSEFEEMLVGAGASRVRDLFDKAKKASPSLIFIDEIDAVARKRGTKIQSGATEQTLNQILVEMDGFEKNQNVIILAATNRPDVLDPAILRPGRFDRQVRIEYPDVEGRKQILDIHGKNKPFAKDVDLLRIAKRTVGFTGADLENILNESAIIAANLGKKEISDSDIDEAISKVILGPAKRSKKRTENEMKLVAYHEAGHAVVAKYIPNSTPVDRISIVSRGSSGGVTMFLPENDEYIMSKGKLIADITVSLGGRAAEEIALDDISTGASNDIEKATAVARRMIQKFGMSKKLGLVQYGNFEENEYLGYAYSSSKEYSEKIAQEIDEEVRSLIEESYANAKRVLTENRDKLDTVASLLLEKEVLSKDEFDAIFK